ncbi:MAG: glycosyltransferase family protein [Thermodesulfobacteriota bacterium]
MARILFGVMGDSLGHLTQAVAVVREMRTHEFLFMGGGRTLGLRREGFAVEEVPMPSTHYYNNRVDFHSTIRNGIGVILDGRKTVERVSGIIREFKPDLVLSAYEYFSPMVARKLGITSVSIDNQHFLSKCVHLKPGGQSVSRLLFSLPLKNMFSRADRYFVNCFFPCVPIDQSNTEVFPPLLSPQVQGMGPTDGDHVLVYQTSPTFGRLVSALQDMPHQFVVYGLGDRPSCGNLEFKKPSRERFLHDLAHCRYVITNGGHNVISEALYLGKPVFSFPIRFAYEQFFNACMLRKLGYGDYSLDRDPTKATLKTFEDRLAFFRERISRGDFCGNRKLVARLEELLGNGATTWTGPRKERDWGSEEGGFSIA